MTNSNTIKCADCRWCHVGPHELCHCHLRQWDRESVTLKHINYVRRECQFFETMDD